MHTAVPLAVTADPHSDDTPTRVARLCTVYGVFPGVMALRPTPGGPGDSRFGAGFFVVAGLLL